MRADSIPIPPLREYLFSILCGSYTSRQLNSLINLCLAIASELLQRKPAGRKISSSLGLTGKDLAFDCIAELFQRNEVGAFVQLEAYFAGFDFQTMSNEELLIALRRLVYSRVNQSLFRMYHDVDPVFSRILRNVKLAAKTMAQFDEVGRFGETFLRPALCDSLEHLPEIDPEDVKHHLISVCTGNENIPQMLGKLANFLRHQESHSRLISLINTAALLRSVYKTKNEPLLPPTSVESTAFADELTTTIRSACQKVRAEHCHKYIETKKVPEEVFDNYFRVIEQILLGQLSGNGEDVHYYDLLKTTIPLLTRAEYRTKHRAKLEYLGLLVQKQVVDDMRLHG